MVKKDKMIIIGAITIVVTIIIVWVALNILSNPLVGYWEDIDHHELHDYDDISGKYWHFSSSGELRKTGGWECRWKVEDETLYIEPLGLYGQYPNQGWRDYSMEFDGDLLLLGYENIYGDIVYHRLIKIEPTYFLKRMFIW